MNSKEAGKELLRLINDDSISEDSNGNYISIETMKKQGYEGIIIKNSILHKLSNIAKFINHVDSESRDKALIVLFGTSELGKSDLFLLNASFSHLISELYSSGSHEFKKEFANGLSQDNGVDYNDVIEVPHMLSSDLKLTKK